MVKNNDFDFDLIVSSEDLKRNREKCIKENKIKKEIAKKNKINQILLGVGISILVIVVLVLVNLINSDMEKHIEKVSKECAMQGYGITAKYTKEGDKYYVCKK